MLGMWASVLAAAAARSGLAAATRIALRRRRAEGRAALEGELAQDLRGVLAAALGAGDGLVVREDELFELMLTVFANVFVDGHRSYSLPKS
jgi:hypothetical protein